VRRVLITGARGFIGTRLLRALTARGDEVHAVSREPTGDRTRDVCWWQTDLSDVARVRDLVGQVKPQVVFHLASHVVGARSMDLVLPTFRDNLASTVNLLMAASETGCQRVVVTGSLEEPDAGESEAVPSSPYAAAKWGASAYARMFHALYACPVVILRLFMVYGPGQADTRKLIPYVTLSLLQGRRPSLTSGARPVDWIYVDDVVDALILAGQRPGIEGRTIEVGSGHLVTVREVVEHLVALIDPSIVPDFGAVPDRPLERVRAADVDATDRLLGPCSRTPLIVGLRNTVTWYRDQLGTDPSGS
jgi:nucleoside-diphosphate-sugar epimerase